MKVFKVVCEDKGRLYSMRARGAARVEYVPGEWVEAPGFSLREGYGLFAYSSQDEAMWAAYGRRTASVWEAEAEGRLPTPENDVDEWWLMWGRIVPTRFPFSAGEMFHKLRLVRKIADHRRCYIRLPAPPRGEGRYLEKVQVALEPGPEPPTGEAWHYCFCFVDLDSLLAEYADVGRRVPQTRLAIR